MSRVGRSFPAKAIILRAPRPSGPGTAYVDSGTTSLALTPSVSEAIAATEATTVGLVFTPTAPDTFQAADAITATIALTASVTEFREITDSGTVSLAFTPSVAETHEISDSSTAVVKLIPSSTDTAQYIDIQTAFITDDFSIDQSPISGNWTAPLEPGDQSPITSAGQFQNTVFTSYASAYWNLNAFGANVDVVAVLGTKATGQDRMELYARLQNPGASSVGGYMLKYNEQTSGADMWRLFRLDNGVEVYISGGDQFQEVNVGDEIRLRCSGSSIEMWYRSSGGSWTLVQSVTDTTYPSSGYVGLGTADGGAWNSFTAQSTTPTVLTLTPSATEFREITDSGTAPLVLTPSVTETAVSIDSTTAAIRLTPSTSEVGAFIEASTTPIALVPTSSEVLASIDSLTANLAFTASSTEVSAFVDASTVNLVVVATMAEVLASTDAQTCNLVLTPSTVEGVGKGVVIIGTTQFVAAGSVTSGVVPLPAGWQQGDAFYIFAALSAATGTLTVPGGYSTVVASFHSNSGTTPTSASMAVFRKVLTASESDPTVQCTSGRLVCIGVLLRGADLTTPEDGATSDDNTGVAYPSCRAPSVTPASDGDLILYAYGVRNGTNAATTTFAPPVGQTELNDRSTAVAAVSNAALSVGYEILPSGATGTRTATESSSSGTSTNPMGVTVAVRISSIVDSGTANLAFTPSSVETAQLRDDGAVGLVFLEASAEIGAFVDANAVNIGLVPSPAEVLASTDAQTSAIKFTPSVSEVGAFVEASTVAVTFLPGTSDVLASTDAQTSNVVLTPSGTETYTPGAAFLDSATVPLTTTASSTQIFAPTDTATAPLALVPSVTELVQLTDASVGALSFTPSYIEVGGFTDASATAVQLTVAGTEVLASVDSLTSIVAFTPSATEVKLGTGIDAATAPVVLLASSTDVRESAEAAVVSLGLTGSGIDAAASVDSQTSVIRSIPSSAEVWESVDARTASVLFSVSGLEGKVSTEASTSFISLSPQGSAEVLASVDSLTVRLIVAPSVVEIEKYVDQAIAFLLFGVSGAEVILAKHVKAIFRGRGNGARFKTGSSGRYHASPVGSLKVKAASGRFYAHNQ